MTEHVKRFDELTADELYRILQLRVDVFVVEQNCPYRELDDLDQRAVHVWLEDETGILAYLRVMDRGAESEYISVGRVVSARRGRGLGSRVLRLGIRAARQCFGDGPVYLEAQTQARGFYEKQGFRQISEEFMLDGIPHIRMLQEESSMPQTVLITGTGRPYALGFNLVRRYLEHGDTVFASIRRPSEALEKLRAEYPGRLHILTMDIASTESVNAAEAEAAAIAPSIDLIINNATTASADTMKELPDFDLDLIAPAVNVGAVGPIRVLKAFLPMLKKSESGALVVNISSEAGSIGKCYRTYYLDYGTEKAALNMLTMTMHNYFKNDPNLNIICLHPGWMRTNPDNHEAPLDPYEHAETLRLLFESRRHDPDGPVFITHTGEAYPW